MDRLTILCPLVEREIDAVDCMENRDTQESFIPEEFKKKNDWKELCKACQYNNY